MRVEPLEPRRIRYPTGAYGWVDLRIVTEGYLRGLQPEAALVYLFLCTVGNRAGLSFWSRSRIAQVLNLTRDEIDTALAALTTTELIAANDRIVQVLPVPDRERRGQEDRAAAAPERPDESERSLPAAHRTRPQQHVPLEISDDEIRLHEAEARARIARFYAREPSTSTVRAFARSLACKERP